MIAIGVELSDAVRYFLSRSRDRGVLTYLFRNHTVSLYSESFNVEHHC